MKDFRWDNLNVLVTGGSGFIGSYVVEKLLQRGAKESNILIPRSFQYDLTEMKNCLEVVKDMDMVIHLAAVVGGIGYTKKHPGTSFYKNMIMNVQLMEAARIKGVKKFVSIGSACSYPKHAPVPFKEEDLFNGYPEETNASYGYTKLMMLVQSQAYRQEFGMNAVVVVPFNAYGPRDNFDRDTSHVIPALIRKCLENQDEIVVWGDGSPSRSFIYAEDFAEGVVLAAEKLNEPIPVNIGTDEEITIKDLLEKIIRLTGFKGRIVYDTSKPNGQPRRCASIKRARELLGFTPKWTLEEGLKRTIEWYKENYM
ncbi:GDP-L-fucose synthase family protein [Fonticella tunisiensis]|uniref:GDP-L-fucose synthase n=1 Tax=Fonticella tunisiensis TaxID=1096341 RepID=A0A4R7KQZ5_9CLOT|nr:GDP-L-fucose synthase [Fonticella tunisiensis]TDT61023.1 GDP-L-fucose synthase [Fonticella tunisiensis]